MNKKTNETNRDFLNRYFDEYKEQVENFFYDNKNTILENYDNQKVYNSDCGSIEDASKIYLEYMEGMSKFFEDLNAIDVSNVEKVEMFTEKYNTFKVNNTPFIESLFNGTNVQSKKMTGSALIENVTDLSCFNTDKMLTLFEKIDAIKESGLYTNKCKDDFVETVTMFYDSLLNYCKESIELVNKPEEEKFVII